MTTPDRTHQKRFYIDQENDVLDDLSIRRNAVVPKNVAPEKSQGARYFKIINSVSIAL